MYLSRLRVEIGPDSAREYPGQLWLRNLYHVHQRLWMAFPDAPHQEETAPVPSRGSDAGFLFRIDPGPDSKPVILVQSALKPVWESAFYNARHFLVDPGPNRDPWEVKVFNPSFEAGQRFRFRLLANPTTKVGTIKKEERERLTKEELKQRKGRHGRRVPVPSAEELRSWRSENPHSDVRDYINTRLEAWLNSKADSAGFSIQLVTVQPDYSYFKKPEKWADKAADGEVGPPPQGALLRAVRFDGVLKVTEPEKFRETLIRGIGPGKAFGFGLLSVAPYGHSPTAEL